MKPIRFLFLIALWLPVGALAHPGDHHEHNLMTILGHFLSEPDHQLMLAVVLALLLSPKWLAGTWQRVMSTKWFR